MFFIQKFFINLQKKQMSLYQKHRPSSLDEVRGNEIIIESIASMLANHKTCPHAFLLHGATGCGKTTIGRGIVHALGVHEVDFQEIDSADFRGIDTIREIRKNCMFKPMKGAYRVYLLDECHQMSKDAQNALLKILEDTPPHVFFILCTTDPGGLISTIKGRCSSFEVKPLSDENMKSLLKVIARKEGSSLDKEVIDQIILDAQGHPRNAIQILEQVLNTEPENRLKVAKQTAAEQSESIELCRALLSNSNWKQIATILDGLKQQNPESIRRHVLGYAQSVLLKADNPKAGLVLELFLEPTYNSGFPQIVFACYSIIKTE